MKENNHFAKYGLLLMAACLLAAVALSLVYRMTAPAIKKTADENLLRMRKELLPVADTFREVSPDVMEGLDARGLLVGAVAVARVRGYGGELGVAVGSDKNGAVIGVKILSHKETPGLGTKAFAAGFLGQYLSLKLPRVKLKKDDPANGAVDAITGATITSRAVTKAVAQALSASSSR